MILVTILGLLVFPFAIMTLCLILSPSEVDEYGYPAEYDEGRG